MMSMVSVVSQGRRTALLTGIFSAAVVSMVSRVIDPATCRKLLWPMKHYQNE